MVLLKIAGHVAFVLALGFGLFGAGYVVVGYENWAIRKSRLAGSGFALLGIAVMAVAASLLWISLR